MNNGKRGVATAMLSAVAPLPVFNYQLYINKV